MYCRAIILLFISSLHYLTVLGQHNGPLCFDYTSVDAGMNYMNDKSFVIFPFINCSTDTVVIENVVYRGERGKHVYNSPYNKKMDTIAPMERDTIKFYKRQSAYFESGMKTDLFAVRFVGKNEVQLITINSMIRENKGKVEANPVEVPTVWRGEAVRFYSKLKNYGTDPVTLRYGSQWMGYLKRIDDVGSPFTIYPGEEVTLGFEIETAELLAEYKGALTLETNEQGSYPTLKLEFYGKLISNNHPSIKFDSLLLHKYVDQFGDGNFEFWFENNGDAPLIIKSAKTSCGCMVATYPRQPIAPGERNVIKVKYDTKRLGPINKSVTVQTNIGSMPVILRVKGEVNNPDKR